MAQSGFAFPKHNRLTGKKNIETLLRTGEAFFAFPYRVVYTINVSAENFGCKVVIAVPKKKCKLATQRNRIKRVTREAYRLQYAVLQNLCIQKNIDLHLFISYTQSTNITYVEASVACVKIMNVLCKKLSV